MADDGTTHLVHVGTSITRPVDTKMVIDDYFSNQKHKIESFTKLSSKGPDQKKIMFAIFWQLDRILTVAAPVK